MDIWAEKWRPKNFEDVIGQESIVKRLKSMVEKRSIPHLLFTGPAGTGKTTLSLVIAKELFKDFWSNNLLELNASDERGIDVIRTKVKDFARTKVLGDCPFKIIYLDECDSLTKEAQQALRRTMEQFSNNVRFILSCNYLSKIIEPIQSRCTLFTFQPLEKEDISQILNIIIKNEKLNINDKTKNLIITSSKGDVRKAENILQACSAISNNVDEQLVKNLIKSSNSDETKKVLELAIAGDFIKSRDYLLEIMLKKGLSGLDIIKQISSELWDLDISDTQKLNLMDKCGEIEFRMTEGSDEFLQLQALLANFVNHNAMD